MNSAYHAPCCIVRAELGDLQVEEQKRSREGQQWEGKERDAFEQKVAARSVIHVICLCASDPEAARLSEYVCIHRYGDCKNAAHILYCNGYAQIDNYCFALGLQAAQ